MRKHTIIQADNSDRRSRLPELQSLKHITATEDFVYAPIMIKPLEIKVLLMTEVQAALVLNIPADDLRMERERGAINYRLANGNIRYTMNDLQVYVESVLISANA
jgi:hypothetical protein